jgi:hypothetical protein
MLDLLMAEAVLGRDAEEFLNTELGRYMLGRCEQEIQEAQDELSRVSSWRRRRIQELQNRVWRAKSVKEWLAELIANGKSAEAALEETE